MDLAQLTDDQMDKLRQFQDIANMEEIQMAVVTLDSCDWNLENAIEAQLGGAPVVRANAAAASSSSSSTDSVKNALMGGGDAQKVTMSKKANSGSHGDNDETRTVERILDKRMNKDGKVEYLVKWEGLSNRESTWENEDNTSCPELIEDYERMTRMMDMRRKRKSDPSPVKWIGGDKRAARIGSYPYPVSAPLIPADCESALEGTRKFQSVFKARYRSDGRIHLMPPFFIGTLQSAIREAFVCPISKRRSLALYIHHDGSVVRNFFPTTVLSNDQVLGRLRSQFILWPWDVTAKENEDNLTIWLDECSLDCARPTLASFLREVDRFPLLILLTKEGGQLRMVGFVHGSDDPDEMTEKLVRCVDAQKESNAREIWDAKEAEERAVKEQEEKDKEDKEIHIATLESSLPAEPPADAPGICTISFQLPEQRVVNRRFTMATPLSVVLTFLESEGFPVKEYRMMNSDSSEKKDISEWNAQSTLAELNMPADETIDVEER